MLSVPEAILAVREGVPGDAYVSVDAGFSKPLLSLLWESNLLNSNFSSHGMSTMGYSLPAANALALVYPESTVIGFMGDGSLMMRATEIAVAVQQKVAPIYVVFVDRTFTQIAVKQGRRTFRQVGVHFNPPSCKALAETFGAIGFDVSTAGEVRDALAEALRRKVPALIGIEIDTSANDSLFDAVRG